MPFAIPRSGGGRGDTRRAPAPRPAASPTTNSANLHSPRDLTDIDNLVSLSANLNEQIETTSELLTITNLLEFASRQSAFTTTPPLTSGSFNAPTTSDDGQSGGDASYVAAAQAASGNNPARSDLDGLAPNTYQLKMDIGAAFGINTSSIGGREYRPYKSDHTTGHAIDVPGQGDHGNVIAAWGIARAELYKLKYVIFNYRIWYPGRGWKTYNPPKAVLDFASDAGHVHHVHFSTY